MIFYQGWLEIAQCLGGLSVHNAWEGLKDQDHGRLRWKQWLRLLEERFYLWSWLHDDDVSHRAKCYRVFKSENKQYLQQKWETQQENSVGIFQKRLQGEKSQTEHWVTVTEQEVRSQEVTELKKRFFKRNLFLAVIRRLSVANKAALLWSPQPCFLFTLFMKFVLFFFRWQLSGVQKAIFQNTLCLQIVSLGKKKQTFMFTGVALVPLQIIYLFPLCKRNIHAAASEPCFKRNSGLIVSLAHTVYSVTDRRPQTDRLNGAMGTVFVFSPCESEKCTAAELLTST